VAGGGVLGALTADRASAQASGQVGTSSDPVDVEAFDLNVQDGATFNGSDISNVGSLNTTNMSFVRAYLSTSKTGITADTRTNIIDSVDKDNLDDINNSYQIVVSESGEYEIEADCRVTGGDDDAVFLELYNVDDNDVLDQERFLINGSTVDAILSKTYNLTAGKAYEVTVKNANSEFDIESSSNKTELIVKQSIVQ